MKRSPRVLFKNIYFCWSAMSVKKVTLARSPWGIYTPTERKGLMFLSDYHTTTLLRIGISVRAPDQCLRILGYMMRNNSSPLRPCHDCANWKAKSFVITNLL